jgi:histidine triad (HIT) family protein
MTGCIFCRIVQREIPTKFLHEDDHTVAFADINPQAPVHLLVVPKRHIESVDVLKDSDAALIGHLILTCTRLAREKGIAGAGYRLVANTGFDGGQTVSHLHVDLLGGRAMTWPPG